jgi:hypothetical protein
MSCRLRSMVFDSCQPPASNTNLFAYNDQTLGGSTMISPLMIRRTTSARLHRHSDSAIKRLPHCDDFATMSTSFGAMTHDRQDCDFKARLESLPDSTTRLDTRGLLMRERHLGSSSLVYPLSVKEEARSKDISPTHRLEVEGKKPCKP